MDEGREIEFVILCPNCGYKTGVKVIIDWGGRILSGKGDDHSFVCMNCSKPFTVPKESLKVHTDRFV